MLEWSISDGPESLDSTDVNTSCTFIITLADQSVAPLVIRLTHVGAPFGGNIKSFAGLLTIGEQTHEIVGTYNVPEKTGHCQTTALD